MKRQRRAAPARLLDVLHLRARTQGFHYRSRPDHPDRAGPDLLGISKGSGNFVGKTWHILSHLNQLDGLTTAAGLLSLGALVVLRRFLPLLPGSDNIGQVRDVLSTAEESGEPAMFATLDEALASVSPGGTSNPGLSPGTGDPPTSGPAAT